jgi:photosystem II stability/assembly factor-like uncharacterized protein
VKFQPGAFELLKFQKPAIYNWYRAVAFSNKDLGWIAGENGCILRTVDGGATWKKTH